MKKEYKRGYAAALLAGTKPADHNRTMQLFIETLGLEVGPQGYYHIARKTHEEKDADCEGTVQPSVRLVLQPAAPLAEMLGQQGMESLLRELCLVVDRRGLLRHRTALTTTGSTGGTEGCRNPDERYGVCLGAEDE
jgi:hypothetical protein